jgi:putative FmdB family regulatory protein
MPIYEYRCRECDNGFEALVSASAPQAQCPSCGSEELSRELSLFASRTNGPAGGMDFSGPGSSGGCCGGACGCGH